MTKIKNMAYWKAKNTLPGINHNSEGNTDLPDGRSGSSPFQDKVGKHLLSSKKVQDASRVSSSKTVQSGKTSGVSSGKTKVTRSRGVPQQYARATTKTLPKLKTKGVRIPKVGGILPILAYEILKEGVKRVFKKDPKLQLPEAKATKFSGGKTWKEAKEAGKTKPVLNKKFNFKTKK